MRITVLLTLTGLHILEPQIQTDIGLGLYSNVNIHNKQILYLEILVQIPFRNSNQR